MYFRYLSSSSVLYQGHHHYCYHFSFCHHCLYGRWCPPIFLVLLLTLPPPKFVFTNTREFQNFCRHWYMLEWCGMLKKEIKSFICNCERIFTCYIENIYGINPRQLMLKTSWLMLPELENMFIYSPMYK